MTFPIPQGRSDPRVQCLMMAEEAVAGLTATDQDGPDTVSSICLMNLMRLLERYRHDVMHTVSQPTGILEDTESEPLNWVMAAQDPMETLEGYMDTARAEVFGADSKKGEVVTTVRRVLRRLIEGRPNNEQEAANTQRFFEALLRQLEPA